MAYTQFSTFAGGLNLRDKADVVSDNEAIDLLNVTFTERGAIRRRDGYSDLTAVSLTNRVDSLGLFYSASGTRHILAGCGTRLEAIGTGGAVVASQTGLASGPYSFAPFAAPGTELTYAANGSDTIQNWNGTAWASGATSATVDGTAARAMPKAGSICVVPNTNRLVATAYGTGTTSGPGGTTSNPSRVHFSNVGDPTTWETDGASRRGQNYIDLTPGDGEQIMACVSWRELVFVFKETKFFVFYGESQAANGTPIFNYRSVVTGVGLAAKQAITVARNGVYFMSRQGVYVTTGSDPALLSDRIRPIWNQDPEVYFQSSPLNLAQIALCRLHWHNEQLYLAYPSGTASANDRVLVYDIQHQWWSLYDIPASALVTYRRADQPELHFGYSTGNNRIGRFVAGTTVDLGANTITSRWQSGWGDYNIPLSKEIRDTRVWGTGSFNVSFATDFRKTPIATNTLVLSASGATWPTSGTWSAWIASIGGVWPGGGQVTTALIRRSIRGNMFSTKFSNASGSLASLTAWSVHRVSRHLREGHEYFSNR